MEAPDLIAFAARLGLYSGCRYLIMPKHNLTQPTNVPSNMKVLSIELEEAATALERQLLEQSVMLYADLAIDARSIAYIKQFMHTAPVCVVAVPVDGQTPYAFEQRLKSEGLNVEFAGYAGPNMLTAVIGNSSLDKANGDVNFKVVALLSAYNEEDIVEHSIRYLLSQGIHVYVMDNWSLDSTWEKLHPLASHPLFVGYERFPLDGPDPTFNWLKILRRKRELSRSLDADWFMHYDVDEIRSSPWPQLTLMEAIRYVDGMGYNAIDHTVLEFQPIDNDFNGEIDFGSYFNYFEFGKRVDHFQQIKAWKNTGQAVLLDMGGHDASFEARKVCPYKFLMKHYSIRSQIHGEQKVFRDRKPRWNPEERATFHHTHYDHIDNGYSFLRNPAHLIRFGPETFFSRFLIQRLTGIGIPT